jgi:hypothetical protein
MARLARMARPRAQHWPVDMAFCMSKFGQHALLHVNMHVGAWECQIDHFWCCNCIDDSDALDALDASDALDGEGLKPSTHVFNVFDNLL